MNKKQHKVNKDEAFEALFSNDSKDSANTISIDTNIERIFYHNISDVANVHPSIDRKRLNLECDFLTGHDIPQLDRNNAKYNCDEFSIFFAALCAVYYQFYISKLCGIEVFKKKTTAVKNKLIQCIEMLTQEYKELYDDENINFFISRYDTYNDPWHKKKCSILKNFVKKLKCSDEDFSYLLFSYCTKFFKYGQSPVIRKDLYRVSLFCAYNSNINLIYKNANGFFLEKLIEYKNKTDRSPDNLKLIIEKNTYWNQFHGLEESSSFFWNLDDIIAVLKIDNAIKTAKVHYSPFSDKENESPRQAFVQQEKSIISLIKRCFGKSIWDYGTETESREQVTTYLRTALATPQSVIKRFPSIAFFIYWSISFVKYNEFKSMFLENANKPEAYQDDDRKHTHIKASEYKKFVNNDFVSMPMENEQPNQASILQYLVFFALLDLTNIPKLGRLIYSPDKNKKLVEKFKEALLATHSIWYEPKTQLELLNELLNNNDLPIIKKTVDFRLFDGITNSKGFAKTESAINLIYNIITFTTINSENGIIQQVNHLDELRNRTLGYHSEKITSWNSIKESQQSIYRNEFATMQSIDCGFDIKDVAQKNLDNSKDGCSRNLKCKVFSETDTSCVTMEKNSKPFRQLYRTLLSTLYIKPARNMHVHYAPFTSTEKLLELRNFNDLLGILYDIKDRIENESILFSIGKKYDSFKFSHRGAFFIDGTQKNLNKLLQEIFIHIINSEPAYIQKISKKNKDDFINPFSPLFRNIKSKDPISNAIYEKMSNIYEYKPQLKAIPDCLAILKDKQNSFMDFINDKWNTEKYREIIASLDFLKDIFSTIYWDSLPSDKPTNEEKNYHWKKNYEIESWESFFEWKIVIRDMESAKESLNHLDYFQENISNVVNLKELDTLAQHGDYDLFEKDIQEIAKQMHSHILFKDIYSARHEFGICENYDFSSSRDEDESLHYIWYQSDIHEIAIEKNVSEMKNYLKFIDYKILKNEYFYPYTPNYKIDFIHFLVDIDSLISSNFTDGDLITFSKELAEKAKEKLSMTKKDIDSKSIEVFKNSPTHNIHLLEITKSLLQRTICYLTSLENIRTKLNGKPLLNANGDMPFSKDDFLGDRRKGKVGFKEYFDSEKYENPLQEDLQKYLNFIFGITGHYQRDNDCCESEKTLLDLYENRFFLYLLRVTFEISQIKSSLNKVS